MATSSLGASGLAAALKNALQRDGARHRRGRSNEAKRMGYMGTGSRGEERWLRGKCESERRMFTVRGAGKVDSFWENKALVVITARITCVSRTGTAKNRC